MAWVYLIKKLINNFRVIVGMVIREVSLFKKGVLPLLIAFSFSIALVSAAIVTVDTPSAATYGNTGLTMGVTFDPSGLDNATGANYSVKLNSATSWTVVSTTIVNTSDGQALWNYTFGTTNFSTDASYDLNISLQIANGTVYEGTVTNVTHDASNPNVTVNILEGSQETDVTSAAESDYGEKVIIECNPNDAVSDVNTSKSYISVKYPSLSTFENITLTTTTNTSIRGEVSATIMADLGIFEIFCYVYDNAGNLNQTSYNLTTITVVKTGNSPFIDPEFEPPIANKVIGRDYIEDFAGKYGALPEQGEARLIKKDGGIKLLLADEEHTIEVQEIGEDSVTLLISSDPFTIEIGVNQTEMVDVNADGKNDLEIYLHKIHQRSADLVFKEITHFVPVIEDGVIEAPVTDVDTEVVKPTEEEANLGWLWVLLALVFVAIVLMIIIHKISGRSNSSEGGKNQVKFTPRDLGSQSGAAWSSSSKASDGNAKPFY